MAKFEVRRKGLPEEITPAFQAEIVERNRTLMRIIKGGADTTSGKPADELLAHYLHTAKTTAPPTWLDNLRAKISKLREKYPKAYNLNPKVKNSKEIG